MIAARGFRTEYGRALLPPVVADVASYAVVVHPEPWAVVAPTLPTEPSLVIPAAELTAEHLRHVVEQVAAHRDRHGLDLVVGLGGGTAMDTAKWVSWQSGIRLVQVPSLPSVNACFTRMVAIRDGGGVRYEGDAVPDVVLVDHDLMLAAPSPMLSGGIGDVLSCHTARYDWLLAVERGVPDHPWDDEAASASAAYLDELEDLARGLAHRDDEAIRWLMECHRDIGWRCHDLGHARFEEGSEHFFAYTFEAVTGRTIMHGDLVTLGVLVMSAIQGNDPMRPRRIAERAGARTDIGELGVTWDEIEATLRRLPSFVEEQVLWHSAASGLRVDDDVLAAARDALHVRPTS